MSAAVLERENRRVLPNTATASAVGFNGGGRPPLHSGDRLTRLEFERRYEEHPELKAELLEGLNALLACPYKVLDHWSAVRPAVKGRRPLIGTHPQHKNVSVFNGMGTKGISLAPYFAQHFTQHLLHQTPLMPEVDVQRFLS